MPKYEDLEFLTDKILNMGNESKILEEKNIPVNKTSIPEKITDFQVEAEKDILDSNDLLKDITEDFKETADIEENFSDLKEEKVDDFLSSLTSSDISNEDDITGLKPAEENFGLDELDIESISNLSSENVSPKNIFEKQDLTESQKDWENLKEESLSDLDLLNMEEQEIIPGEKFEDITPETAEEEPAAEEESEVSSSIFDAESSNMDLTSPPDESGLDNLLEGGENGGSIDDLFQAPETTEDVNIEQTQDESVDAGLADLAGDFALNEPISEQPIQADGSLSELFPDELKDDNAFDDMIDKSEETPDEIDEQPAEESEKLFEEPAGVEEKQEESLQEDSAQEITPLPEIDQISFDQTADEQKEEKSPEQVDEMQALFDNSQDEFDLTSLDNLSEMQENEFEIEKQDVVEEEIPADQAEEQVEEEIPVEEKAEIKSDKKDKTTKDGSVELTDSERKKIVSVLSRLPKEAELKIAKTIISDKYSDRELKPLIDVLIAGEKTLSIIKAYERLTGDKSLSKIEISKFTGEEFQKYRNSFSYQFKKNILPVISLLAVVSAAFIVLLFLYFALIKPTINASINYGIGKKNLREKRFDDVEKYFNLAYDVQPRYNEVVEYADLYRQYKRYLEAEKKYDLAMNMKPNTDLRLKIADFYRELSQFGRSEQLYNEILKDDRNNLKAELGAAKTYFDWSYEVGDKINYAKDAYREALRINEKNTEAVMGLLDIYIHEKSDGEINKVYKYAEKNLKKINPASYADLAGYYIGQEKLDDVKKILQKATKNSGKTSYPEIDYQWARYKKYLNISNEEKDHLENAISKLEYMKEHDQNRYETDRYKSLLASAYNDLGENYDRYSKINIKAEEYFLKALNTYPKYGKAYYNLGLFEMKNKADLVSAYNNFTEAENNGYTDDNLSYLLGLLEYKKGDFMESFKRINLLLDKYPDNSNLKLMVGTTFYRMEKYDLAESMLSETYEYFSDMKQARSPLSMGKKTDRNIVGMLISIGNNLGATLQKQYEETNNTKFLIAATKYYGISIENFKRLNEIPDSVLKEEVTDKDFDLVKLIKFMMTNSNKNLQMVLYPKLGVDEPSLFDDFPPDFRYSQF